MSAFKPSMPVQRRTSKSSTPPNLLEFMLKGWSSNDSYQAKVLPNARSFRKRRARLSRRFPGEWLVIPSGHPKVRANDTHYSFRPGTDFYYLTGNLEPDCVLVLQPSAKGHKHLLFVKPSPGRTDASFFADQAAGEFWVGRRAGVAEVERECSITCRALPELEPLLKRARTSKRSRLRIVRGFSTTTEEILDRGKTQRERDKELATFLSEMRLIKDTDEVKALENAISATKRGFEDVIARLKTAKSERELEGVFWTRARMEGNDVGYTPIVAAGAHACTLHWTRNDGALRKGDLLLLDAGVEGHTLYTADITRTLPISGRFSSEQRAIYELVLEARRAALSAVRPGNDFMATTRAANAVLAQGLERLKILQMSAAEALREENQFYRRYSLHNVSHMLGLDVHDCAKARAETYGIGKLKPGMVLTVEPGLYFQADDLTVPAKYRGIGVRIEDDVLVTSKGHRVLTRSLPIDPDEVEHWIRTIWKGA